MNKKQLYESIMKNVAKEVKKSLNENVLDSTELDSLTALVANAFKVLGNRGQQPGKRKIAKLDVGINVNAFDLEQGIKDEIVKRSAGFIIEGFIANVLKRKNFRNDDYTLSNDKGSYTEYSAVFNANSDIADLTITLDNNRQCDVEIKAFKDGRVGNITLTKPQAEKLYSVGANTYYVLVDYSLMGTSVIFNHAYVLNSDDALIFADLYEQSPSKHISVGLFNNAKLIF